MPSSGLRFVHTADWQIGRQYQRFEPEDAAALSEARFSVVQRIADYATQNHCDAVLVAGDVFDAQTVSERTLRRLFNAMQGFDGPWVMIPGNHDAALAESVWSRSEQLGILPRNLHLAVEPKVLLLPDLRLAILPAPLTQRRTHVDLTAWFDHADTPQDYFRVGLAHGSVSGILPDEIDASNPIAADRARTARLDYLALGDWHGMRAIDDRSWYSGSPETDRFRNNLSGHVLDVTLESPGTAARVEPIRVGHYTWDDYAGDINVPSDLDQVLDYLQDLTAEHVVSVTLSGRTDLAGRKRLDDALAAAQARVRALEHDMSGLMLQPTDDDIAALQADGYVGDVVQALMAMQRPHVTQTDGTEVSAGRQADARVARDALALLAGILQERS